MKFRITKLGPLAFGAAVALLFSMEPVAASGDQVQKEESRQRLEGRIDSTLAEMPPAAPPPETFARDAQGWTNGVNPDVAPGPVLPVAELPLPTEVGIDLLEVSPEVTLGASDQETSAETIQHFVAPGMQTAFPPLTSVADTEVAQESASTDAIRPEVLRRPFRESTPSRPPADPYEDGSVLLRTPMDPPLGFTGPSGIIPGEFQENSHFVPVTDRWREGFPAWDRYDRAHPFDEDYPYTLGHWWDPFNQNVLKGDYPIIGEQTFLNITAATLAIAEGRGLPNPTTPFESTARPFEEEFFGRPEQFFYTQFFRLQFDLFHGDTAVFKPIDWAVRIAPVFNVNHLDLEELAIVNPNVLNGTTRSRTWTSLEEWFFEMKISDLSPHYDFMSVRAGSQFFNSDFRGFMFVDVNRGVRLFGTGKASRTQFNILWFDQTDKDINSELNTFHDRNKNTVIMNYYREDTFVPGYTTQFSFLYDKDQPSFVFDNNQRLARPDPVGVFTPHQVESYYLGWNGDGHIGRYNLSHSFYWALGRDSLNPLGGQPQSINAQMFALEASYDRDWFRFRSSFLWYSGDHDINDQEATGFDSINDNPAFAGGEFSYWNRQGIPLQGVNLVQRFSLVPDLRSSKVQGQPNFVNPGLFLYNVGFDVEATPKLRFIQNTNCLWFDSTEVLRQFLFQDQIANGIGVDVSLGAEYRPLLNNNVILVAGIAGLFPWDGFRDIYENFDGSISTFMQGFMQLELLY
ncbi:hypothetical protein Pan216_39090 [Planctomycetes bacterium Pan216]|uniref:Alginate export domain-containing protein n=1 Tax=Kolteria novifilia TaxID=2527975 RepID=A0A518B7T3_9BACT|nr:hypothetical protein Pan216_39090 [Planctomycetes bacterium Pan216]